MSSESQQMSIKQLVDAYWKYVSPYRWKMIGALFASAAAALCGPVLAPLYYKKVFDLMSVNPHPPFFVLFQTFLIATAIAVVGIIFWYIQNRLTASLQIEISKNVIPQVYQKVLGQSDAFFSDRMVGSLNRQINRFGMAFEDISDLITSNALPMLISVTGVMIVMSGIDVFVAATVFIWAVTTMYINYRFVKWRSPLLVQRAELDSAASGIMSDGMTNAMNVRLFSALDDEVEKFKKANVEFNDVRAKGWNVHMISDAIRDALTTLLEAVVMGIAIWQWTRGALSLGSLVLFETYIFAIAGRVAFAGYMIRRMFEATSNAKEAIDLIETPNTVVDKRRAKKLQVKQSVISFQRASFAYHQTRTVLKDFSLEIRSHEKIALVGSSGAGKSTVIKLLFRLYDVTSGHILIDGQDIAKVTQQSLREVVSLVPQDPVLFHRSLKENIRYGRREATDDEVIEAAKKARCHDFISQLPQGYDTLVGERGVKLSGGERQRVAIARAILRNAPILVLDEATSALDSESEHLIQEALGELMKDKTVIVIAHRLSTIMQMDRIIVMEDGKVVDQGTHDVLLQKVGIYQKLWNIQAGGFAKT